MAGILFIVNVPKKEYENNLKENNIPNLIYEKEKYENASKVIHELKEKHLGTKNVESYVQDDSVIVKCRSIDCFHQSRQSDSYKCKSETIADGLAGERKSYVGSWEDIKQVIKPKKNKLKISRPVRSVDVVGAFCCDTPLETILSEIVSRLDIKNAAWYSTEGDKFWQVTFSLESGSLSEDLLQVLRTFGIGSRYQSSVSLLPCALYYKSDDRLPSTADVEHAEHESVSNKAWSQFSSSVRARNNLAQVLHAVRAKGDLTFDWVFMLLVAAFVAAIGLIENSTVILVASMLISPLMSPITAGTMGTVVQDRSLQRMGVKNEFLGLFMCLIMGFLVGVTTCALDAQFGVVEDWPTEEMLTRCAHRSLWIGILVAIPSGVGCALAVLGDYTASLVGVAISASLLPPAVNAGLLWSMALTRVIMKSEEQRWSVVQPTELALLGTASLCLTLVNIVCIFLAGVAVYKVKEVRPLERRNISWWKANRNRFNPTKQQTKGNTLNWDAYTQWCTNSLERKQDTKSKEKQCNSPSSMQGDTVTSSRRPSLVTRLKTQDIEAYCQKIQLEDNYIHLNSKVNEDLEKPMKEMTTASKVMNLNEENRRKSNVASSPEHITRSYNNMAYENDDAMSHSRRSTIEPSLNYTGDKKYGLRSAKTFDV